MLYPPKKDLKARQKHHRQAKGGIVTLKHGQFNLKKVFLQSQKQKGRAPFGHTPLMAAKT
ncbi:hypothetical protein KI614_01460 [Dechloromonas denitrificans]|uniref:hypothetical protein n=1 Tax=Dechloromonas denitrificans TaxID=281362 RepID=UPI001CF8C6CF|nr:hypothetical protein [Dechloromonas denitrificans]UCV11943.1 hypothetical protein KI614_01460 [Dechloromonas denitrificans]